MRTWPVAVHRTVDRAYIGVPDRLGDGSVYRDLRAPSLEEVVGDDWSGQVLARMLPADRHWAWWARAQTVRACGISLASAPASIDLRDLAGARRRRMLRIGMNLVVIPLLHQQEQRLVLEWSGADSEQAEHVWTAPDGVDAWDADRIVAWCQDEAAWRDPRAAVNQVAERILTSFDGYQFLAVGAGEGGLVWDGLEGLARQWGLDLIPGNPAHAWVTPPT